LAIPIKAQQEDPIQLNKKANEFQAVGEYAEAIPYAHRAVEIEERRSGLNHPNVGILLNNLTLLYNSQGCYNDAEPLHRRSWEIREKSLGNISIPGVRCGSGTA